MDITNLINNNNNNNLNNNNDKDLIFEFPNQFIIVQPSFNHYQYNQNHQQQEFQNNNNNNNNCNYYSENTSDDETYNSDDSSIEFTHTPIPSSPSMISDNCSVMPTTPTKSNQVNYIFHNLFINENNKHLFQSYFSKNHYKRNEELIRSN